MTFAAPPLAPADAKPVALPRFRHWPLAWRAVVGCFALFLLFRALSSFLDNDWAKFADPGFWASNVLCILLSFGMLGLLALMSQRGLLVGLLGAAALGFPTSLLFATGELVSFYNLGDQLNRTGSTRTLSDGTIIRESASGELSIQRRGDTKPTVIQVAPGRERLRADALKLIARNGLGWYFYYFALGSFFVGMANAGRLREAETRAAASDKAAKDAQLRALRYQVNPHFLFNTLNSLSSLTMAGRQAEAEAMIIGLSTFLRSTLSLDPAADVSLTDEITLQRRYLDIERVRFPERLHVEERVPESLAEAQVPALILQPLVENAIKHGVAPGSGPVTLSILAAEVDGMLELTVENNGAGTMRSAAKGTGVGIANVCARLTARHGDAARCESEPLADGGYRVRLLFPLVFA